MQKTAFVLLNFESPYHVEWRTAEPVIEGFTVHRALIHTSTLVTGSADRVPSLIQLRVSAVLPAVLSGACYKTLLPLPPVPSKIALKKKGLRWITIRALVDIARLAKRELPFIVNITSRGLGKKSGEITVESEGALIKLCYSNEVIHECDETLEAPPRVLQRVEVYLNRVDRISNAADVYKVSGYRPTTKLSVVLQGNDDAVDYGVKLLEVLGKLGIGGMRSRGFGKFVVETGQLCEVSTLSWSRGPGHLILLGSYTFNDAIIASKSIVNKKSVAGYAGPTYDNYILPYFDYVGAGSIVYAAKNLDPVKRDIKASHTGALVVFNPVSVGETA